MTITAERVERPAPSPATATIALAWAEARRMWHSPILWIGTLLTVALGVAWSWTRMPSWETFHENAGVASMVLGAALLMAGHLAAGRDRRAGAEETTRTLPAGPGRRNVALLVTVPIAAATGAVAYLAQLLLLLPAWPVGRFDPWVAPTLVIIPAIGAAVGVLVGRALPGVAAGPLAVVVMVGILFMFVFVPNDQASVMTHLWPVVHVNWSFGMPRPTGWHLLYLVGVLVAVVSAICRPAAPKSAIAATLLAVLFAGFAVHREAAETPDVIYSDEVAKYVAPEALDCRTHEEVRYCALSGYTAWIPYWREAAEPVARLLPAGAQRPSIRQISTSDDMVPMRPGYPEMRVGDTWGRIGSWAQDSRTRLTRDYAATAVGLLRRDDVDNWRSCDGSGQHRTVVALWLLDQAAPGEGLTVPRTRYGDAERQAAEVLRAKPREEVREHLAAHWSEVLDPSATPLAALGVTLTPPPIPAEPEPRPEGQMVSEERGVCR
ncbi:hypothetical protein Ait01nite_051590 [Actinoplanes italicus]|uniref:Uncharacterized protein n=1 Tax=Actinoplanes italicus TaxID=113567 RepID=A0A2T0K076_9ACTN|nr:hypothetical protein [Actinoplanes italicus]PRX16128.1 hypothetical protein CLV67_121177 [Actinoplanes italicus]GIE32114.1 hypothetical protein Ait01nite_051590 [Actinoplanes italicus]